MPSAVFLRAVNVGGTNRCQPALIAKQLAKFDVVNIGAVGTFVVREDVSESALRAAFARRLPFKCEIMICPARDIIKLGSKNPFSRQRSRREPRDVDGKAPEGSRIGRRANQPSGPNIVRFVSVLAKRPVHSFRLMSNIYRQSGSDHQTSNIPTASSSSQSALGRRVAAEDHCDPRQIRLGSVSSADESDHLPRQDREAPGCASHHAQLEHDRKSRENSQ